VDRSEPPLEPLVERHDRVQPAPVREVADGDRGQLGRLEPTPARDAAAELLVWNPAGPREGEQAEAALLAVLPGRPARAQAPDLGRAEGPAGVDHTWLEGGHWPASRCISPRTKLRASRTCSSPRSCSSGSRVRVSPDEP